MPSTIKTCKNLHDQREHLRSVHLLLQGMRSRTIYYVNNVTKRKQMLPNSSEPLLIYKVPVIRCTKGKK